MDGPEGVGAANHPVTFKIVKVTRPRPSPGRRIGSIEFVEKRLPAVPAFVEAVWFKCSLTAMPCTMRTARSRTSGENLLDLLMAPSSKALEHETFMQVLHQHRVGPAAELHAARRAHAVADRQDGVEVVVRDSVVLAVGDSCQPLVDSRFFSLEPCQPQRPRSVPVYLQQAKPGGSDTSRSYASATSTGHINVRVERGVRGSRPA